jgi:hypothetical protein
MSASKIGVNGVVHASWATAGRPASPVAGQVGWNTSLNGLDMYTGSAWVTLFNSGSPQSQLPPNIAGNGPAFSAYANAAQTVTSNVFTKVALQSKNFDTNSNFDNITNYRFTPTVAGYYQFNAQLCLNGAVATQQLVLAIYKNGSTAERLIDINPSAFLSANSSTVVSSSSLIYMNGSTDYVELYGYYYLGTCTFSQSSGAITSRFSGSLVRAA